MQDSGFPMRLQVYLAHCGASSRRGAEKMILAGRVCINGTVILQMGVKVNAEDEVTLDGKKLSLEEKKRYVMLYKPIGYVSSLSDEKGRPVAADLLKDAYNERLYNVGRLDMQSQGLLLFTNDGDFAAKLSHPSSEIEKEYIIDTGWDIPKDFPLRFEKGIRVDDVFYKCRSAVLVNDRRMKVVLIEGKNREIRNVLKAENVGIKRLKRIRVGNIQIGTLKPGEFRDLLLQEVEDLLKLCIKSK